MSTNTGDDSPNCWYPVVPKVRVGLNKEPLDKFEPEGAVALTRTQEIEARRAFRLRQIEEGRRDRALQTGGHGSFQTAKMCKKRGGS